MANLPIFFLISMVLLLPHSTRSTALACEKRYCGNPELAIEFPFQLTEDTSVERYARCGYQGFQVSCNERNQPLIKLPNAGEFVVKNISLERQYLWINDPDDCIARRFLQMIDLKESHFQWALDYRFDVVSFYNCTESEGKLMVDPQLRIPCLSDDKHSVIVILDSHVVQRSRYSSSCNDIGSARFPVNDHSQESRQIREELVHSDIMLQWFRPSCYCKADQHCGFVSGTDSDVICYDNNPGQGGSPPTSGLSPLVAPISWAVFVFLFVCWVLLSIYDGIRDQQQRQRSIRNQLQRRRSMEYSNIERPPMVGMGLGGSMMIDIEQCPMIQLGESGRLPKSIDNVCSICLSEYEPKETLRSMPQCNHYFHAHCIDAWLKMNATCPLCRKLPQGSALVTPLPRFTP